MTSEANADPAFVASLAPFHVETLDADPSTIYALVDYYYPE